MSNRLLAGIPHHRGTNVVLAAMTYSSRNSHGRLASQSPPMLTQAGQQLSKREKNLTEDSFFNFLKMLKWATRNWAHK